MTFAQLCPNDMLPPLPMMDNPMLDMYGGGNGSGMAAPFQAVPGTMPGGKLEAPKKQKRGPMEDEDEDAEDEDDDYDDDYNE